MQRVADFQVEEDLTRGDNTTTTRRHSRDLITSQEESSAIETVNVFLFLVHRMCHVILHVFVVFQQHGSRDVSGPEGHNHKEQ